MSHTGVEFYLLEPALYILTCHVSHSDSEIRLLQPPLLPLACHMPHSFVAALVSTGICNFNY
jgi:hypothetical protein